MLGDSAAVTVFTIGAFAVWGFALYWAWRQPRHRWYHVWVLGLITFFWWVGESTAIRLGKYDYAAFPPQLRVAFPSGGTPLNPGSLETWLRGLAIDKAPWERDPSCVITSFGIPLPVVAFEAALLFGFFRLSTRLLRSSKDKGWSQVRSAAATGGLCALLMVNAFAVLDPVVSTTKWCDPTVSDLTSTYLPFGLWTWFTTETHPGYWFGVPPINYGAWFLAAFVFGALARFDDEREGGIIKRYSWIGPYLLWSVPITVVYLAAVLVAKIFIDRWLVHGQEYLFSSPWFSAKAWQLGIIAALLIGALFALFAWGRRERDPRVHPRVRCAAALERRQTGRVLDLVRLAARIRARRRAR